MMPLDEYEYNLIRQEQDGVLAPDVTRSEWEAEQDEEDEEEDTGAASSGVGPADQDPEEGS